jgi:hypothetical protein
VNCVGIFNPPLTEHRLAFAANALNLPSGSVSSKLLTGAVGDCCFFDLKLFGPTPPLSDERIPNQVNRYAVALQDHDELWEGFSPVTDEIHGAFQRYREDRGMHDCVADL